MKLCINARSYIHVYGLVPTKNLSGHDDVFPL